MIHNMSNKDLLTRCREYYFPGQHMELVPLPDIIKEYKVEEIRKY